MRAKTAKALALRKAAYDHLMRAFPGETLDFLTTVATDPARTAEERDLAKDLLDQHAAMGPASPLAASSPLALVPRPTPMPTDPRDTLCTCGHWWESHDATPDVASRAGFVPAPDQPACAACACDDFEHDPEKNTPSWIADNVKHHGRKPHQHARACHCALCNDDGPDGHGDAWAGGFARNH